MWLSEREPRLLCLSIPMNPKVRQTFMGGLMEPMLEESWHRWVTQGWADNVVCVHIVRSSALNRHITEKSNDSGARQSCLCGNLTPET